MSKLVCKVCKKPIGGGRANHLVSPPGVEPVEVFGPFHRRCLEELTREFREETGAELTGVGLHG